MYRRCTLWPIAKTKVGVHAVVGANTGKVFMALEECLFSRCGPLDKCPLEKTLVKCPGAGRVLLN